MLGLYSLGSTWPLTIMQHHIAFEVTLEDLFAAPQKLRAAGVTAMGGGANRLTNLWSLAGCRQLPSFLMILTAISWNTLRCSTTNPNQNSDCCFRGTNGSPAGKKQREFS
jgi:hypothetical protein